MLFVHLGTGSAPVGSELLGASAVRELAAKLNISPTKKLGQNFVIDPNTVRFIVEQSKIQPDDVVLEVGPGLGSLTLGLLPVARHVIAIEIDKRLSAELPITVDKFAPGLGTKLTVLNADALHINAAAINANNFEPTAIVANLPYNVAVPVLLHLLEVLPSVKSVLVMVQKEVADRICAGPGSRTYGIPSVKVRWYGRAEPAGNIGKNVFWPAPHVDSGLVRINVSPHEGDRQRIFAVVDACFAHRRKTLRAGLADFIGSPQQAELALVSAGIPPSARAETLELDDFIRLSHVLAAD
jgi:16S rRNA (adenine1518-N6/adenine1519-N6)-dimethyltransferase